MKIDETILVLVEIIQKWNIQKKVNSVSQSKIKFVKDFINQVI